MRLMILSLLALSTALSMTLSSQASASLKSLHEERSPFRLPKLPYATNALEPAIDAQTMEIHHQRHHQAYIDNVNKALGKEKVPLGKLLSEVSKRGDTVRNNAGGHWNHSFFWTVLSPKADDHKISKEFQAELEKTFGSFDNFKSDFEAKGLAQFGSGWVWLIRTADGALQIISTPNQDNPLMDIALQKGTPILGLDVWEHAYYLKYQNKRGEYAKNFWSIVNWKQVEAYDREAKKKK